MKLSRRRKEIEKIPGPVGQPSRTGRPRAAAAAPDVLLPKAPGLLSREEAAAAARLVVVGLVAESPPLVVPECPSLELGLNKGKNRVENSPKSEEEDDKDEPVTGNSESEFVCNDGPLVEDGASVLGDDFQVGNEGVRSPNKQVAKTSELVKMAHQVFEKIPEPTFGTGKEGNVEILSGNDIGGKYKEVPCKNNDHMTKRLPNGNPPLARPNGNGNKVTAHAPTPWKDLFSDNRKAGNDIKLHLRPSNGGKVKIRAEDIDDVVVAWGHALVGYIAGRSPGKGAIVSFCKSWKGKHKIYFDASGWIVVKFETERDRDEVLAKGPYTIYGRPFMIKKMPHLFSFKNEKISIVPTWVQFPQLPMEFWNENILSDFASEIGVPTQTDKFTQTKERAAFARVLVEVDVSNKLLREIDVELPNGDTFVQ